MVRHWRSIVLSGHLIVVQDHAELLAVHPGAGGTAGDDAGQQFVKFLPSRSTEVPPILQKHPARVLQDKVCSLLGTARTTKINPQTLRFGYDLAGVKSNYHRPLRARQPFCLHHICP